MNTPLRFLLVLAALAPLAPAQVRRVPADHPTISAALSAATPGATILVAPGVYPENLMWPAVDGIRLIAERGPTMTTIDANLSGRVVTFTGPLSSQTLLQGFTIRRGRLMNVPAQGAGIYVRGCSPTIRRNVIEDNDCLGVGANRGAGIYVEDGAPRIEHNTIQRNELQNGFTAEGAGLYLKGPGGNVLANSFQANVAKNTSQKCVGGAIYVHALFPTIASNHIIQNVVQNAPENRGGGIYVESSSFASLVNNTLADNHATGGPINTGGGIHIRVGVTASIWNSIIAINSMEGVHVEFGATVAVDYNDCWNNFGGNYIGTIGGPGDIFADPQWWPGSVTRPPHFQLRPSSPCIEAGANSLVPATALVDPDFDSRKTDSDLDGAAGNGATVDMGSDEYAGATGLAVVGSPTLGTTTSFYTTGPANWIYALMLGFTPNGVFFSEWGNLLVGTPTVIASGTVPSGAIPLRIPNKTILRGVPLYLQSIVLDPNLPTTGNLTNVWEGVIY